jgi:acyl carrier protein
VDTLTRTIEVIREVGSLDDIGPDDVLYDNGLNSMHALNLLVELEEQYQIAIPDDEFISARTARQLNEMICRLQGSAPA